MQCNGMTKGKLTQVIPLITLHYIAFPPAKHNIMRECLVGRELGFQESIIVCSVEHGKISAFFAPSK